MLTLSLIVQSKGDSGGPLFRMITDDDGREIPEIVGLVSYGYGCAIPDLPAVYTSTAHMYEWIAETLGWTHAPTTAPTTAAERSSVRGFYCSFFSIALTMSVSLYMD